MLKHISLIIFTATASFASACYGTNGNKDDDHINGIGGGGGRSIYVKPIPVIKSEKSVDLPENLEFGDLVQITLLPSVVTQEIQSEVNKRIECSIKRCESEIILNTNQENNNTNQEEKNNSIIAHYWGSMHSDECYIPYFVIKDYKISKQEEKNEENKLPILEGCRLLKTPSVTYHCSMGCDITFKECQHKTLCEFFRAQREEYCMMIYTTIDTADNDKTICVSSYGLKNSNIVYKENSITNPLDPQFDPKNIISIFPKSNTNVKKDDDENSIN